MFVLLETAGLSKCYITYITSLLFVIRGNAYHYVFGKTAAFTKLFITYITCVRFIAGMNMFVSVEIAGPSKRFVT